MLPTRYSRPYRIYYAYRPRTTGGDMQTAVSRHNGITVFFKMHAVGRCRMSPGYIGSLVMIRKRIVLKIHMEDAVFKKQPIRIV